MIPGLNWPKRGPLVRVVVLVLIDLPDFALILLDFWCFPVAVAFGIPIWGWWHRKMATFASTNGPNRFVGIERVKWMLSGGFFGPTLMCGWWFSDCEWLWVGENSCFGLDSWENGRIIPFKLSEYVHWYVWGRLSAWLGPDLTDNIVFGRFQWVVHSWTWVVWGSEIVGTREESAVVSYFPFLLCVGKHLLWSILGILGMGGLEVLKCGCSWQVWRTLLCFTGDDVQGTTEPAPHPPLSIYLKMDERFKFGYLPWWWVCVVDFSEFFWFSGPPCANQISWKTTKVALPGALNRFPCIQRRMLTYWFCTLVLGWDVALIFHEIFGILGPVLDCFGSHWRNIGFHPGVSAFSET